MSDSDAPAERMSMLVTPPANEETNMATRADSSAAAATVADGGSAAASASLSPVVTAAPPLPPHPTLHVHTDSSSLLPIVSPVPVTPDAVPSPSSTPRNAAGGGSGLAAPSSGASGPAQSHSPSLSPSPPPLFLDAFRGCPRIAGTEWRATAPCLSSARGPVCLVSSDSLCVLCRTQLPFASHCVQTTFLCWVASTTPTLLLFRCAS
jgi:hypothetical protein